VGFQRAPKEGSSTFFCGYINLKNGPGNEEKAYDFINAWLEPSAGKALLDTIGYGHTSTEAMATIAEEPAVKEGLGEIDAPILAQTPNDPAQREKQLAEFEKIKAGF
jgi:spermidine/putrescine transport system substrate-binding protein